jgi:hypothetical protein
MKKSLLATAISAVVISTGAYAVPSAVQLTLAGGIIDIVVPCSITPQTGFPFSTTALTVDDPSNVTMSGELCLDPSWAGPGNPNAGSPWVALNFVSLAGPLVGSVGTVFTSGTVDIYTNFGTSSGWLAYGSINVASTPIACLYKGGTGGITAGPTFSGGTTTRACEANLLGQPSEIFMQ